MAIECMIAGALALLSAGQDMDGVSVLSAYERPRGVCRVIVRNDGPDAIDLAELEVFGDAGGSVPVLWDMAEPRTVRPGTVAFVTYRLADRREGDSGNASRRHRLAAEGKVLSYAVSDAPPLALTYLVYDPGPERVYLYLRNLTANDCRVVRATIAGRPVRITAPVRLPAGTKSLVAGQWTPPEKGDYPVPAVAVEVESSEFVPLYLYGRLFGPEHTVAMNDDYLSLFIACLSHRCGPEEEAGTRAVEAAHAAAGSVRTIKFCNIDLIRDAPVLFAPVAERCQIQPQTTYAGACRSGSYIAPILAGARLTKTYAAPGIFHAILYAEYTHTEGLPLFKLSTIRNVAYTCLAAGSKGTTLRPMTRTDIPPSFRNALQRLANELDQLRPLIALSEPVDWVDTDADAWCDPHLLLCGDEGLLLIALPRQPAGQEQTLGPASVRIRPPDASLSLVLQAYEIASAHERVDVAQRTDHYEITLAAHDQARVFFIPHAEAGPKDSRA